jgi:pimeloyl-ACP methyl ester carboxylesterase
MRLAANGRLTDGLAVPPAAWIQDHAADLAIYTAEFARTGFRAALNTYRSLHRNWELLAGWADVPVTVPAFYIGGSRDLVLHFPGMRDLVNAMPVLLPNSEPPVILEGVGHFMQMEQPVEVARLIRGFLEKAYRTGGNHCDSGTG